MIRRVALIAVAIGGVVFPATASADVVTDWNRTMVDALEIAKTPPPPSARVVAIVQSAVFDAVNGIARRYTPVHVPPAATHGASRLAAAAGAAHEALLALFPAQQAMLDQRLADPAAHLAGGPVGEGDGHDLADLGAVVQQVRQVALGKDVRLAAAGAGGEHHRGLAGGHRLLLLFG